MKEKYLNWRSFRPTEEQITNESISATYANVKNLVKELNIGGSTPKRIDDLLENIVELRDLYDSFEKFRKEYTETKKNLKLKNEFKKLKRKIYYIKRHIKNVLGFALYKIAKAVD